MLPRLSLDAKEEELHLKTLVDQLHQFLAFNNNGQQERCPRSPGPRMFPGEANLLPQKKGVGDRSKSSTRNPNGVKCWR